VDFGLKGIFPLDLFVSKPENRPSTIRVNYSLALFKHKVYLYGGMNWDNHVLDTVEEFDASTYKFNLHKIRGEYKPAKGRQAHCAIAVDQYSMYIFGGTQQPLLIDPQPITDESGLVMIYDMDANTFQSVPSTTGDKPSSLIFASVF
jgi:hypothetical protein